MEIKLQNITKRYSDVVAVDSVNLRMKQGELVAILGPSGCGKTTLLRIIAGLVENDGGRIYFGGEDITLWSAQRRNATMVFQSYALFPHMNVKENVAYGLKVRKLSKGEINRRVSEVLSLVELSGYENRGIQELSGGQRQRVALARALVVQPNILLFDEPLSNLDEKLRVNMRREIKKIQVETGITSVYVTHDQEEAMAIADRIVVMNKGRIVQTVSPDELYYSPADSFVADFIGHSNVIKLDVKTDDMGKYLMCLGKRIGVNQDDFGMGENLSVLIRPEEIYISSEGICAKVVSRENLGPINRYTMRTEYGDLTVDILNRKRYGILGVGEKVNLDFDPESIHVLERE